MAQLIDPHGSGNAPEKPNIIIDDDWKAQAQAERDQLARQESEAEQPGEKGLPAADFRGLIGALATQAMMYLGAFPDETGRAYVAPEYARHSIDLLEVLETKTKGNLSKEEAEELTAVLHELRVRFVQILEGVRASTKRPDPGAGPRGSPDIMPG